MDLLHRILLHIIDDICIILLLLWGRWLYRLSVLILLAHCINAITDPSDWFVLLLWNDLLLLLLLLLLLKRHILELISHFVCSSLLLDSIKFLLRWCKLLWLLLLLLLLLFLRKCDKCIWIVVLSHICCMRLWTFSKVLLWNVSYLNLDKTILLYLFLMFSCRRSYLDLNQVLINLSKVIIKNYKRKNEKNKI